MFHRDKEELRESIYNLRETIRSSNNLLNVLEELRCIMQGDTVEYKGVILAIEEYSDRCHGLVSISDDYKERWATIIKGKGNYCLMLQGVGRKPRKEWPSTRDEALNQAMAWIVEG